METSTTISPAERLAIYEKMLPYFEGEERMKDCTGLLDIGFCHAIIAVSGDGVQIADFPEISKHCPSYTVGYWFPTVFYGPDHKRTAILKQAINEVKKLIC